MLPTLLAAKSTPAVMILSGFFLAVQQAAASEAGSVSVELVRLVGTLLATGGVVWWIVRWAINNWEAGRQAQDTLLANLQAEVIAGRQQAEQRYQEDVQYYRSELAACQKRCWDRP